MKTYSFFAMNTTIELAIEKSLQPAEELVEQAKRSFAMIEKTCSRFLPDSELSLLNEQIGQEVTLSPLLFTILQQAQQHYEETNGLFQPGILAALESAGYTQSMEHIQGQDVGEARNVAPLVAKLPYRLQPHTLSIVAEQRLDVGGIAKGWAVDYTAALLSAHADGFLNAGGDLRIFGKPSREVKVGIEHPYLPGTSMSSLAITSGALATSSTAKRRWKQGESWQHHLIDPRTGRPATSRIVSVTVTAPTATEADIWAKTVLLLGEEEGEAWVKRKGVRAVWLNEFGEIWRVG